MLVVVEHSTPVIGNARIILLADLKSATRVICSGQAGLTDNFIPSGKIRFVWGL